MKHISISALILGGIFLNACQQHGAIDTEPQLVSETDESKRDILDRSTSKTGEMCGGMMGTICANKDDYCHTEIEAQCGAADMTGTCETKPEMCTQQYDPVCGCDGKTYGNECSANSKGVSAAYKGECREGIIP